MYAASPLIAALAFALAFGDEISIDRPPEISNEVVSNGTCGKEAEGTCADADFATPLVPVKIAALLNEAWGSLDPEAPRMIAELKSQPGFMQFSHAREVFKDHLLGTFSILAAWNQPQDVSRAGLFHTGYSGDLFQFFFWDATDQSQRRELAEIVGGAAEDLVWHFGTLERGSILSLSELISGNLTAPLAPLSPGLDDTVEVPHRPSPGVNITVSNRIVAKILCVTLADYLDQMVEVNGWRDHHQVESPTRLYPSSLHGPAVALYWISSLCRAIRGHLEHVPPIFGHCEHVITKPVETRARDAYWSVIVNEAALTASEQIMRLEIAAELNPWVAEPHVMLAELHFRASAYAKAAAHAAMALERFYTFGTAWDKRLKFNAWVAFTRLLLLRSQRRARGLSSMPTRDDLAPTSNGLQLVSISGLVESM